MRARPGPATASRVGLAVAGLYMVVAAFLLFEGLREATFSGVYWVVAAFPWSFIVASVLPRGPMNRAVVVGGVVLNIAISYFGGAVWERWWRGGRTEGR